MSTRTAWASRPVRHTPRKPETLGAWVESELERSDGLLFTMTPREELDEIGRFARLEDQAWVGTVRAIVAAVDRSASGCGEFVADEVALALNISPTAASKLTWQALQVASLPCLLEAVAGGMLSKRHALAVLAELDKVPALDTETRGAVVMIALARYHGETPGELGKLIATLILQVDLDAAQDRQDKATADRHVVVYRDVDGQAIVHARGPVAQAAAIDAALDRWLKDHPKQPGDERTERQRRYDAFTALLTGGAEAGGFQVAMIMPFSISQGGDLELAEIPGLGPILPFTARELLEHTDSLTQVAVDENGDVIAVSDPLRPPTRPERSPCDDEADEGDDGDGRGHGPTDGPTPPAPGSSPCSLDQPAPSPRQPLDQEWAQALRLLMSQPPPERLRPQNLSTAAYTTPARLRRYLLARDRTCVFPGCHRRITDVDHRIPWPLGPTDHHNCQLLCRRHHRAKQAVFSVRLTDDGDDEWTTRGSWAFTRHRQGY